MLKVEHIDVYYDEVQALWDVSLEVNEGEIVCLVGANGAGKTTTLRTIAGLLHPTRGSITFQGEAIDHLTPHEVVTRGVVMIPEGRQLWPGMTVRENLELGAYLPEARRKRSGTLEVVYQLFPILKEREKQTAGTLSGGEQQMLAVGRGLLSQPRLLMLDEPSLGLAPKLVSEIFRVVQEIRDRHVTILLVEQNTGHALSIADRAYVLETGRVVMSGSGRELLGNEHVRAAYIGA